jgi:hypothetical protein
VKESSWKVDYVQELPKQLLGIVTTAHPGYASFRDIFVSEMDQLTYQLEDLGYRVWFTTEVEGVEYRLASPIKEGGGVWLTTPSSEAD